MGLSFAETINRDLAPALRNLSWQRTGLRFRWVQPSGDQAVIGLRKSSGSRDDRTEFFVDVSVWPEPNWDLYRATHPGGPRLPPTEVGPFDGRVAAPEVVADVPFPEWVHTPQTANQCGKELVRVVAGHIAPTLVGMLDRESLLHWARHEEDLPAGIHWLPANENFRRFPILVNRGPSAELDEALLLAQEYGWAEQLKWAAARLRREQ